MIEQKAFKDAWAILCERFNRDPSIPLTSMYYNTLSERLTTEQFQEAARRVFIECEFFPRPGEFLERVGVDIQAEALTQWEAVQQLMRGMPSPGLTEESRRVVRLLGGESALRNTKLDAMPFVRRDFLQLYGDAAQIARREEGERIAATARAGVLTAQAMGVKELKPTNGVQRIGDLTREAR